MVHMHRLVLVAFATAVLTGAAGAEDVDGRYQLSPTSEGFLKLDSRSGAVSECKRGPDGYHHGCIRPGRGGRRGLRPAPRKGLILRTSQSSLTIGLTRRSALRGCSPRLTSS